MIDMNDFYNENMNIIKERQPGLFDLIKNEEDNSTILVEKSADGMELFAINKDNHAFFLNSRYNSNQEAKKWADQFEDVSPYTTFIVIGIANGAYLKILHELYPENLILVYEPSVNLYKRWLEAERKELLTNDYIYYSVGKSTGRELFRRYLDNFIQYTTREYNEWVVLPG